ncbi:MAG: TolC family protein, partial [Bacteroidia bacterium]|nr:TolC family protein [Bacteroidia bacterium]
IAESYRGQIGIQLNQVRNDLELALLHFQLLLNSYAPLTPAAEITKLEFSGSASGNVENHPQLKWYQQQKQVSIMSTKLEKSKLLPDLIVGYSNQSIQGMGADNIFYPRSSRFSAFYAGIGIPLFFGAQKARINSSRTLELISENNYQLAMQSLNNEYRQAMKRYELALQSVNYFEASALKNAETIILTATRQFSEGSINYQDWMILINNAISIKSDYTEVLKDLNQSIIQLNYLNFK